MQSFRSWTRLPTLRSSKSSRVEQSEWTAGHVNDNVSSGDPQVHIYKGGAINLEQVRLVSPTAAATAGQGQHQQRFTGNGILRTKELRQEEIPVTRFAESPQTTDLERQRQQPWAYQQTVWDSRAPDGATPNF